MRTEFSTDRSFPVTGCAGPERELPRRRPVLWRASPEISRNLEPDLPGEQVANGSRETLVRLLATPYIEPAGAKNCAAVEVRQLVAARKERCRLGGGPENHAQCDFACGPAGRGLFTGTGRKYRRTRRDRQLQRRRARSGYLHLIGAGARMPERVAPGSEQAVHQARQDLALRRRSQPAAPRGSAPSIQVDNQVHYNNRSPIQSCSAGTANFPSQINARTDSVVVLRTAHALSNSRSPGNLALRDPVAGAPQRLLDVATGS